MAGIWRISFSIAILLLLGTTSAHALHGRLGLLSSSSSLSRSSSGWSAPMYYYYCPPPPPMILPVPDAYPKYATPTPAPPSSVEPPIGSKDPRAPKIIARSIGASDSASKDRCRVGFWNLTGRDVNVTIEGKAWALPEDQALTFDIERQFTWHVAGRTPRIERVPDGQAAFEVIIRE